MHYFSGKAVNGVLLRFLPIWIFWLMAAAVTAQDGLDDQLRYERVREARDATDQGWRDLFAEQGLAYPPAEVYVRAFKFDGIVEVWVPSADTFARVKTYEICSLSGELGPKRRRGDGQIPEGFYRLTEFNPVSSYHLSLRVNYPNEADRLQGFFPDLGGDIFIHGDCVTIGCIPIEDVPVMELYWLALQARELGGDLPVHIFPFRMDEASLVYFQRLSVFDSGDWAFWAQLEPAYRYFELNRTVPDMRVGAGGRYYLSID